MNREIWKQIPGYEAYEVSTLGRIRKAGLILKQHKNHRGYWNIHLWSDGVSRQFRTHRLVLTVFVRSPHDDEQGGHLDGNKDNNSLSNLDWITAKENSAQRVQHGTQVAHESHPSAKLTVDQVRHIRKMHKHYSTEFGCAALARRFDMHPTTIQQIVKREIWRGIDG